RSSLPLYTTPLPCTTLFRSQKSVKQMRREDLIRFFRHHYRPDQLVVSVAGQVSHEAVKKRIRLLTRSDWRKSSRGAELDLFQSLDRKSTRLNSSHVKISYAV